MKKCRYCGQQFDENIKFCPNCGQELEDDVIEVTKDNSQYEQINYCRFCGEKLNPNASFCPRCGNSVNDQINNNNTYQYQNVQQERDAPSVGFGILSFFFPIVGLVLFITWRNTLPLKAKSCGIPALVSVILNILLSICYAIIVGFAFG